MAARRLGFVIYFLTLGMCLGAAWAGSPVVRVLALFPGKAMLSIDGKNHLLSKGQRSPEGVQLLDASAEQAIVLIDGETLTLRPGGVVSSRYSRPEYREVRVIRNARGAYAIRGRINGRSVDFLVDTGASYVTLTERDAAEIGVDVEALSFSLPIRTANGTMLAEPYGVRIAHALSQRKLEIGFGIFLSLVAIRFFFVFF